MTPGLQKIAKVPTLPPASKTLSVHPPALRSHTSSSVELPATPTGAVPHIQWCLYPPTAPGFVLGEQVAGGTTEAQTIAKEQRAAQFMSTSLPSRFTAEVTSKSVTKAKPGLGRMESFGEFPVEGLCEKENNSRNNSCHTFKQASLKRENQQMFFESFKHIARLARRPRQVDRSADHCPTARRGRHLGWSDHRPDEWVWKS